jgi:hypothetical protein
VIANSNLTEEKNRLHAQLSTLQTSFDQANLVISKCHAMIASVWGLTNKLSYELVTSLTHTKEQYEKGFSLVMNPVVSFINAQNDVTSLDMDSLCESHINRAREMVDQRQADVTFQSQPRPLIFQGPQEQTSVQNGQYQAQNSPQQQHEHFQQFLDPMQQTFV